MRVLYVNHTAQISGGERSLLTLLAALRERADLAVGCPSGPLADAVAGLGIPHHELPGTAGSLKLHPRHTPVALADLARASGRLGRVVRTVRPDIVHANSIRAGIVAGLPRTGPRVPLVAHVRDVLPDRPVSRATRQLIARRAAATVGNSKYALERFAVPTSRRPTVIYNPVDVVAFGASELTPAAARERLGLPAEAEVLAVVAQLTPWKGQDTAIRALGLLGGQHPGAHLLLVGSAKFLDAATRFDNRAYVDGLHRLVGELGLGDRVAFLGERDDVPDLLRAVDLLLMPSEEEPFGRALVEAMAAGVPVVATSVGGPPEIVKEGVDGMLLEPGRPETWARAVADLLPDRARRAAMGAEGRRQAAMRFAPARHVDACLELYAAVAADR